MHTTSYGAAGFVEACGRVGATAAIASDRCHVLDRAWAWSADALVIDFAHPEQAADTIVAAARADLAPVDAVLPVGGELPARVAALAAGRLGLPANAPEAMVAAGNKLVMRRRLADAMTATRTCGSRGFWPWPVMPIRRRWPPSCPQRAGSDFHVWSSRWCSRAAGA